MSRIIISIISGLLVGVLARWLYPGSVDLGWIMTALLGVAGSLFAGLLLGRVHPVTGERPGPAGCLASVLGAMALIWLARLLV